MKGFSRGLIASLLLSAGVSAAPQPDAASRTYAQNYKDAALALCVAKAYASEPAASKDASAALAVLITGASMMPKRAPGRWANWPTAILQESITPIRAAM